MDNGIAKDIRKSGAKCAVISCNNSRRIKNSRFFSFPKNNTSLFQIWAAKCGLPFIDESKNYFICHNHFTTDCYLGKRYLRKLSIPTLNLNESFKAQKNFDSNTFNFTEDKTDANSHSYDNLKNTENRKRGILI